MKKKLLCTKFTLLLFVISLLAGMQPKTATAASVYSSYTAPDGFQVVSYAREWSDPAMLKGVYDELLRNTHGEEFKLLRRVNIYPGADPQGMSASGRWYGRWELKNGIPSLVGNRYIDIYHGSRYTNIKAIARTLAHEYGHHFTYYYYFKTEKRGWEQWRNTGLASVRNLKNNMAVGIESVAHRWIIQEIAAEDYVQLFGSPTAKESYDFKDISERLKSEDNQINFDTNIYNYYPQENYEIPLASNYPGIKKYWLKASGLPDKSGSAPSQNSLKLQEVTSYNHINTPQYLFSWNSSTDDKTTNLEYTLVWFKRNITGFNFYPVKTVYSNERLSAFFGAATGESHYMWEEVPTGVAYFAVYVKDSDKNIRSSKVLAVDFSNRKDPDTILIDDYSMSRNSWFPPRVTVNKKQLDFDVTPFIKSGRILVPLRGIFEEMDATVSWEPSTKTVKAVKDGTSVVLQIGSSTAYVNNSPVSLEVQPVLVNGRTMVPLRFISEALGAEVGWNSNLQLAKIIN